MKRKRTEVFQLHNLWVTDWRIVAFPEVCLETNWDWNGIKTADQLPAELVLASVAATGQ